MCLSNKKHFKNKSIGNNAKDIFEMNDTSGYIFSNISENDDNDKTTEDILNENSEDNPLVKQISLDDIMGIIIEKLNNGGKVTFSPKGTSMLPMLRDGEDMVVLEKPKGRLKIFDIPLYKRKDGKYILHRVVNFDGHGGYVMCGDNQFVREYGIYDEDIIAVVVAFNRKGKTYDTTSLRYNLYVDFWYYTRHIRRVIASIKRRFKSIFFKDKKAKNEKANK